MENGNKRIVFIFLFCLSCVLLIACNNSKNPFTDSENKAFFRNLLLTHERDEIVVKNVESYFYDNTLFYHVYSSYVSVVNGEWRESECVYLGNYENYIFFNPNWTSWGDAAWERDAYLEAVEKGEHKSFSEEEIEQYVNDYYKSKENK